MTDAQLEEETQATGGGAAASGRDEPVVITKPGVYPDLAHDDYHRDPVPGGSLSHSGARKLMPPNPPAKFAYEREHPTEPTKSMEFGSYAHAIVLGVGPDIVHVDADNWISKADQATRKEVRARGGVALNNPEHDAVMGMVAALEAHDYAMQLLRPYGGINEASLFWRDQPTGVMLRTRLDVLPPARTGRMIATDYKTATRADEESFSKATVDYSYHTQSAWLIDGLRALELATDVVVLFVVQERTPPYLVNVLQMPENAVMIGRALNRRAISTYAECTASGHWPGFGPEPEFVSLPEWYVRRMEISA